LRFSELYNRVTTNPNLETRFVTHRVSSGDTLISIASRYGLAPGTLRALNGGLQLVPFDEGTGDLSVYTGQEIRVGLEVRAKNWVGPVRWEATSAGWGALLDHVASALDIERGQLELVNPQPRMGQTEYWLRLPLPEVPNTPKDVRNERLAPTSEILGQEYVPLIPSHELVFEGVPPAYEDDIFPAEREEVSPYACRIGDVLLHIPPEFIAVNKISRIEDVSGVRTSTPIISTDGQEETEVRMTFYFVGDEGINGISVESPYAQYPYEMDGLRAFLAQIHACPFLPVKNEYLNNEWGIYALAVGSVTIRTVEGFPDVLRVDLVAYHFNPYPYLLREDIEFHDHFIWPLFRWYYQRMLHQDPAYPERRYYAPFRVGDRDPIRFYTLTEDSASGAVEKDEWQPVELEATEVIGASFGVINILTNTPLQGSTMPTHQFMGSLDDRVYLVMETTSRQDLEQLDRMKENTAYYARIYRDHVFKGYVRLEWGLANTLGIRHCVIESLQVETVPNFPGTYRIALSLRVYNPFQFRQEALEGFAGRPAPLDIQTVNRHEVIEQDIANEMELNRFPLYPDLDLPTYGELRAVIRKIQSFRQRHQLTPMEVTHRHLDNPRLTQYFVEPDFFLAYQLKNLWEELSQEAQALAPDSDQAALLAVDPHQAVQLRTVPLLQPIPPQSKEEVINGMWHDAFFHEPRGRLVRAFPTYLLVFIDEGIFVDGRRLWDIPYVSHALVDVIVNEERDVPVNTCRVVLHDVYGATQTRYWHQYEEQGFWERFFPTLTEEMLDTRRELIRQRLLSIQAGARLHLRMGYGSLGTQLPIVFNGTVVEITRGPEVVIVAQSDGSELIQPVPGWLQDEYVKNTYMDYGQEPHDILKNLLAERHFFTFNLTARWGRKSPLGINHFGMVTKNTFLSIGGLQLGTQNDDEISKNIYPAIIEDLVKENPRAVLREKYLNPPKERNKDEPDIQMWLYQKSVWDVAMTLAGAVPDYIFMVHPHQFRSTAFFGLPHWPVRYGFWIDGSGQIVERYKPLAQAHHIHSHVDIILNELKASSREIATVAHIYYHEGNTKRTYTLYADKSIRTDRQKVILVESGIVQDFGSFRLSSIQKGVDIIPDLVARIIGIRFGERWARFTGMQTLRDRLARMYQGQIALIGDATLRPRHLLYINDRTLKMAGLVQVRRITHVMSVSEGFRSLVEPDLVTSLADSAWNEIAKLALSSAGGVGLYFARNALASLGARIIAKGTQATQLAQKGYQLIKGTRILQQLRNLRGAVRAISTGRSIVTGITAGIGAIAAAPFIEALAFTIAGTIAINYLVDCVETWIVRNENVVALYPIFYRDAPYVAGIDGHEHLIPGWTDQKLTEARLK
jgi:hypothetical protein